MSQMLDDETVVNILAEDAARYICDAKVRGLRLRIGAIKHGGRKTWSYVYRTKDGRHMRRLTFGSDLTTAEAQALAQNCKKLVRYGQDPQQRKQELRQEEKKSKRKRRPYSRTESRESCVYLIAVNVNGVLGPRVGKIGTTTNLKNRLQTLQAHSPVPLKVLASKPGNITLETILKRKFTEHRRHGEWFTLTNEIYEEFGLMGVGWHRS